MKRVFLSRLRRWKVLMIRDEFIAIRFYTDDDCYYRHITAPAQDEPVNIEAVWQTVATLYPDLKMREIKEYNA